MRASFSAVLCLLCLAPSAFGQSPAPDERARALEGRIVDRFSGQGVAGVTVKLFDAAGTLMDLTHTDDTGKYRLDLGVLDPDEYAALSTFRIEAGDDDDHAVKAALSAGTSRDGTVIRYRVLSLP